MMEKLIREQDDGGVREQDDGGGEQEERSKGAR